ncbi:hypothetical protein AAVH_38101, partial [Aphelenchoides avenae]
MYKGYSQHSQEAPLPTTATHTSSHKRNDGEMSNSYSNEFRPTTLPDGPVNGARPGTRDGPMSHSYSGNTLVSPGSGNHSPMVAIPRVRNVPIRREQPVLSKDDPLYQLHGANGERTISAGAYVPQPGNRRFPNSFVAQRVDSFNNGRLDRRASAGGRLAPASGRSTPLSYNLRRTTPPEGASGGSGSGPGRLVAHYYPPESVASTASEPIGGAGASRVLPTSASLQLQRGGSAVAYAPTPSSSSTEPPTLTTPSESHSAPYPHDRSTPRGAAPAAAFREAHAGCVQQQQIPETDILDSSCSDDDEAVRGCETESFRQDTGQGLPMN